MLVDITIKLSKTKFDKNSLSLSPVAAIKDFPLDDQKYMWLLRSGLITVRDQDPAKIMQKFDFIHC